jgi:endonuclease/exonuclease/phosphatase (EEP) superfamily protein YafD
MQAGFEDPFALLGQTPPPTDPAVEPEQRIDYVWLRGLSPTRAWVADSLASDHRMVVTEVEIPR